ncbi:polysaccharide deacetylase family protein [Rossellomorea sp. BNER]|jgi:peptidoglycan-N-acetylglucosamine deacetylase|uniref:polysaccharide deacetylase family protein n=1 Tax=Rossellomorea sp. BNER TaxID=2962031 RepID=UPI003AF21A37|nr:polysaccharide deacetylase family protein [Rossellomorea sp. BNER]
MILIFCALFTFFLFLIYTVFPTLVIRIFGVRIIQKISDEKSIALTFDDGPDPDYTHQLLDLLKRFNVKASFFVVGEKVKHNPEIVRRMHAEGHTIGIHHFHHISSWIMSPFRLREQLRLTEEIITECTKEKVYFYRPPWGHFNLFSLLVGRKYSIIMWNKIFKDWKTDICKNNLLEKLHANNEGGSIFLLHDSGVTLGADQEAPKYMIKKLEKFLEESRRNGIKFISLNELYQFDKKTRVI